MENLTQKQIEKLTDTDLTDLLRTNADRFDKATWDRLHKEAKARGWEDKNGR